MLTALFLGCAAAGLLLHYFLVERPKLRRRAVEPRLPEPLPPAEAARRLPEGAFLQPQTFTWTQILSDGSLLLGIHPLVISLIGSPYRFVVTPEGWHIARGKPVLRISSRGRELQMFSPVSGYIREVNPHACQERGWAGPEGTDDCWIYRIEPENLVWELPAWLVGAEAQAWVEHRLERIRAFITDLPGGGSSGPPAAELPVGVLGTLGESAWHAFQHLFLHPDPTSSPLGPLAAPRTKKLFP